MSDELTLSSLIHKLQIHRSRVGGNARVALEWADLARHIEQPVKEAKPPVLNKAILEVQALTDQEVLNWTAPRELFFENGLRHLADLRNYWAQRLPDNPTWRESWAARQALWEHDRLVIRCATASKSIKLLDIRNTFGVRQRRIRGLIEAERRNLFPAISPVEIYFSEGEIPQIQTTSRPYEY